MVKTPDAQDFANWITGLKLARAALVAQANYEGALSAHLLKDIPPDVEAEYWEARDDEFNQELALIDAAIKALEPLALGEESAGV